MENDKEILFASSQNLSANRYLANDPVSLIFANITSMMGGRANMWEGSKKRPTGLVDSSGRPVKQSDLDIDDNC